MKIKFFLNWAETNEWLKLLFDVTSNFVMLLDFLCWMCCLVDSQNIIHVSWGSNNILPRRANIVFRYALWYHVRFCDVIQNVENRLRSLLGWSFTIMPSLKSIGWVVWSPMAHYPKAGPYWAIFSSFGSYLPNLELFTTSQVPKNFITPSFIKIGQEIG